MVRRARQGDADLHLVAALVVVITECSTLAAREEVEVMAEATPKQQEQTVRHTPALTHPQQSECGPTRPTRSHREDPSTTDPLRQSTPIRR